MLAWGENMPKAVIPMRDAAFLSAALEGLELQKSRLEAQIRQVRAMLGGRRLKALGPAAVVAKPARKRELSAAARRRIARAQKRRWAEYRRQKAAAQRAAKEG